MNDRLEQVNWLKKLADVISYYDCSGEGSIEEQAGELVGYWEQLGEEPPDWFDSRDRGILVEYVAELIK